MFHSFSPKWPNDVWTRGSHLKIAGMLVDTAEDSAGGWSAVMGLGLNVNGSPAVVDPSLAHVATSVAAQLGSPVDRELLLADILNRLEALVLDVGATGRASLGTSAAVHTDSAMAILMQRYRPLDLLTGTVVQVSAKR